jgi:hypothetical protein
MINPLYFSDYIRPALSKIRFYRVITRRFLVMLFSRDKQLALQQLDYRRQYQFEQSFLVIRYRFRHALWYHFEGISKTTDAGVIALNLRNIPEMPVKLTIHGFFRKMTCYLEVVPEVQLQAETFRASISKPHCLRSPIAPVKTGKPFFPPRIPGIKLQCPAPERLSANIRIKHSSFH